MATCRDQYTAILSHHHDHSLDASGGDRPFLNVYIGDEMVIQFAEGILTKPFTIDESELDDLKRYMATEHDLTYDEMMMGWDILDDENAWELAVAADLIEDVLQWVGHDLDSVTHISETSCPSGKDITWENLDGSVEIPATRPSDPHERLTRVYEHLHALERDAGDVPDPFPLVRFYVEGDAVPYTFGPSVHTLDSAADDERDRFESILNECTDGWITDDNPESICGVHPAWTPDSALQVSDAVLDQVCGVSIDEIDYAEITDDGPAANRSWLDV